MSTQHASAPIPALIYGAKSTEDDAGSIPTQHADCLAAIEREGGRMVAAEPFADEAASAYKGNRGEGLTAAKEAAIAAAREHGQAELWLQHSDRVARGDGITADHLAEVWFALRRHRVRLRSVQDDGNLEDAIRVVLIGERNHEDSKRKSGAVQAGKRRRFEAGGSTGRLHDGYMLLARLDADGRPVIAGRSGKAVFDRVPDPDRRGIIERAFALADEGHTPGDIARAFNAEGIRTLNGKTWITERVRRTLADPWYAGDVVQHGERRPGVHEGLVDRERFERVQARLHRQDPVAVQAQRGGRRGAEPYLLRGVAQCARCGSGIYTRRYAAGRFYVCGAVRECRGTCDLPRIPADLVEAKVLRHLDDFGVDLQDWLAERAGTVVSARAKFAESIERQRGELATIERRIAKAQALADRAMDDGEDDVAKGALGTVTRNEAKRDELAAAIAAAAQRLADWPEEPDQATALAAYRAIGDYVHGRIERADGIAELNVVLRDLFERCTIDADDDAVYLDFSLGAGHLAGLHAAFDEAVPELLPPFRLDGTRDLFVREVVQMDHAPYDDADGDAPRADGLVQVDQNPHSQAKSDPGRTDTLTKVNVQVRRSIEIPPLVVDLAA